MKQGFTLVELLAVIVILAIILAIAIPGISGIIESSTESAFVSDAKMLLKAVDYKLMQDDSFDVTTVNVTNVNAVLGVSGSNYQTVQITTLNGKPYVVLQGQNKWSGLVAYGSYIKIDVTEDSSYNTVINQLGYDSDKGVNEPKLAQGMTPIKWNGTAWVNTTSSDPNWYNYDTANKIWANAKTADGSMWVWIPRYIYKITANHHVNTAGIIEVQFSKGIDDNWNSGVIGNVDTGTTSSASNNKWTNHPAFTFVTELTGIWVAKFEATAVEGLVNPYSADGSCPSGSDNVTTKTIQVLPNKISWRCIKVGNMFTNIRNMETKSVYGWVTASGLQANGSFTTDTNNLDTHLMKSIEWGAVAYISKSQYGKNADEIWINNANDFTTGCAGNAVSEGASTTGCINAYNTTNGVKASTTGNIYGIYDISGGAWEYVAAYVDNANGNLGQGSSIIGAGNQYKDVYTVGGTDDQANNYALTVNKKGDAVWETSNNINGSYSWFSDYSVMPNTSGPWFMRGGRFASGSSGAFSFIDVWSGSSSLCSFRPVLAVSAGL